MMLPIVMSLVIVAAMVAGASWARKHRPDD
jgi:hypothetical protein